MDKEVYDMFDKINEGLLEDLRKTNIKFPKCDAEKYVKENKKQSVVQFYEYIVAYFKDYKKNL